MRIAFFSITVGISVAMGLKNGENLSSQVVGIALLSEMMSIVIFGLLELS